LKILTFNQNMVK